MTLRHRGYLGEQAGSGAGKLKPGKSLSKDSFGGLKKGDLLIVKSKQFNAVNVAKILRKVLNPSKGIRAIFVDPNNPKNKRMPDDKEFFVWADDLGGGQYFYVR